MAELSLRHLPDLDVSAISDFSDSSFQIPAAAHNPNDLLLADNTVDFFSNVNDVLNTPAAPVRPLTQPPLTLAELTPRPKPTRAAPAVRASLRPQPKIATPHRAVVASELSTALSEDLSPFRNRDPSFQIPPSQTCDDDELLMADGNNFFAQEAPLLDASPLCPPSPLTLSQPTPGPTTRTSSSVTPTDPSPEPIAPESRQDNVKNFVHGTLWVPSDNGRPDPPSTSTLVFLPSVSEAGPEEKNNCDTDLASVNGKDKALPRTLPGRQKKPPGGDKSKRKRVATIAAASKPAKLKPLTASITRRLSIPGKKPVPAMRRRPLLEAPSTSGGSSRGPMAQPVNKSSPPTLATDDKAFKAGGLADALMSFGQKLIANTQSSKHCNEASSGPRDVAETKTASEAIISASGDNIKRSSGTVSDLSVPFVPDPDYLTLSQLSPRKHEITASSSTATVSRIMQEALTPAQLVPPSFELSERPPSPMRRSVKRAGSPTDEPPPARRKRSKPSPKPSAPPSSKEYRPSKPLQPSRAKNTLATTSNSGPSGLSRTRRVVSAAVTTNDANRAKRTDVTKNPGVSLSRSLPKLGPVGEINAAAQEPRGVKSTTTSKSKRPAAASSGGCRSGRSTRQVENIPVSEERLADGQKVGRSTSAANDKHAAHLPSAKPTRPVEFQFATSSRMDVRSKGGDPVNSEAGSGMPHKHSRAHAPHSIPDFKTLHAAQQSVLAQRRADIHPTVPVEFGLATEARAHEREKYEEGRRARDRELERQAEERRRQRELEEEAEIKELRRRAVPKANEVPEWYAHAPKKARADTGS